MSKNKFDLCKHFYMWFSVAVYDVGLMGCKSLLDFNGRHFIAQQKPDRLDWGLSKRIYALIHKATIFHMVNFVKTTHSLNLRRVGSDDHNIRKLLLVCS